MWKFFKFALFKASKIFDKNVVDHKLAKKVLYIWFTIVSWKLVFKYRNIENQYDSNK